MISNENYTLFILGAGANAPYGFPTGEQLKYQICNEFENYYRKILPHGSEIEKIYFNKALYDYTNYFKRTFWQSSTPSIDLFLSRNPDFQDIGKIAILLCLIEAEKESFQKGIKLPEENWLEYLFNKMSEALTGPKDYKLLNTNNIKFITFNYDRLLENFFAVSMQNSFSNFRNEVLEKIKQIPIEHVYGKLGLLPWQADITNDSNILYYGNDCRYDQIEILIDNLKLIQDREKIENNNLKELIRNARRIFFLGFSYADENLRVLGIPEMLNDSQKIYGTAFKNTPNEILRIKFRLNNDLGKREKSNIIIEDCNCLTLLRNHL